MAAMIATLPVVHFVCNIVVSETPEVNNNSTFVLTQPPCKTQPLSLPPGYVAYPHVNAAYKFVDERVTRYVAKERCARDNAHLAVIDTALKLQLVGSDTPEDHWTHVGIYRTKEGGPWLSARTGLPLSSIPWGSGHPGSAGHCVQIYRSGTGLGNWPCTDRGNYICELPI